VDVSAQTSPIYSLLPAVFRMRDATEGGPLQALFQVLEEQHGIVRDNVWRLYEDQFIETCAPWVIPYIGELIGFDPVYTTPLVSPDSRAEVANTIGYRRRKGTLVALEQVTADVSGRSTIAVEEFKRLVTTLSLRDVGSKRDGTADLRHGWKLAHQDGPFTQLNRTIDVRNITPRARAPASADPTPLDIGLHGPGRFNIQDVAVWMWRWQAFQVTKAAAVVLGDGGYFFSAFGAPIPLFQPAPPESAPFARPTSEAVVPEPITLRRFHARPGDFYPGAFELFADGQAVPLSQIVAANLTPGPDGSVCTPPKGKIAIDPERGRIQYAPGPTLPKALLVSYNYGAPAAIGGGPYDRTASIVAPAAQANADFSNAESPFQAIVPSTQYPTLKAAVAAWNKLPPNCAGSIALTGFETLSVSLVGADAIRIPSQSVLLIASATATPAGALEWNNACVALEGDIEIFAPAPILEPDDIPLTTGQVQISGVWQNGRLLLTGAEANVQIADSTLTPGVRRNPLGHAEQPGEASVVSGPGDALQTTLHLNRVVCGPIALNPASSARILNSIVDAGDRYAVAFSAPDKSSPGGNLHIEETTIIGRVWTKALRLASNTLFIAKLDAHDPWLAPVWSERVQTGCVRFSWLPSDAITPGAYECLPPNAASQPALEPKFISLAFGDPSYCLLSGDVATAIWKGADNGSQIGVYYQIQETEAVANIAIRSQEYLPANLQRGVFLIPSQTAPAAPRALPYGYGYGHGAKGQLAMGIGVHLI
jgi:hypothetical protein